MQKNDNGQKHFDEIYITAAQIIKDLKVTRSAILYARRSGKLPPPIVLNDGRLMIWQKSLVQPYLEAWKIILTTRRRVHNAKL
jgi:hypothetical protein